MTARPTAAIVDQSRFEDAARALAAAFAAAVLQTDGDTTARGVGSPTGGSRSWVCAARRPEPPTCRPQRADRPQG